MGDICNFELHGFSDTSIRSYSASCYLKAVNEHGVVTKIVGSKAKVVPLKSVAIPRLELIACVLLAELVDSVRRALEVVLSLIELSFGRIQIFVYIG